MGWQNLMESICMQLPKYESTMFINGYNSWTLPLITRVVFTWSHCMTQAPKSMYKRCDIYLAQTNSLCNFNIDEIVVKEIVWTLACMTQLVFWVKEYLELSYNFVAICELSCTNFSSLFNMLKCWPAKNPPRIINSNTSFWKCWTIKEPLIIQLHGNPLHGNL
jgi:hypothetical protein